MEIRGTIKVIKPEQQIGATFKKREFVISTNEQYVQNIQLELHGDKTDIIDAYTEGQEVICGINIRGKLWTNPQNEDKYFNTLVCWKIQPADKQQEDAAQFNPPPMNNNPQEFKPDYAPTDEEDKDNLPF